MGYRECAPEVYWCKIQYKEEYQQYYSIQNVWDAKVYIQSCIGVGAHGAYRNSVQIFTGVGDHYGQYQQYSCL